MRRKPQPKPQPWTKNQKLIAGAMGGFVVIGLILGNLFGSDEDEAASPEPSTSVSASPTPTSTPSEAVEVVEPAPDPTETEPAALSKSTALVHLAYAWEAKFIYGGKVHYLMDVQNASQNDDGSFDFKVGATVTNEYGTEYEATIEGTVAGTDDDPIIVDSILYTAAGDVVEY